MWRWLPAAKSRALALCAALVAVFYGAIAIAFAARVMDQPVGLLLAPLFALLAWGMWSLSRFARWVSLVWLWILALLMPIGLLTRSPTPALLAGVTPVVLVSLALIYIFGKHKREFKWP